MSIGEIRIERKEKVFVLGEYIEEFEIVGRSISFVLKVGKAGTPRMDEILTVLGISPEAGGYHTVVRKAVVFC